MNEGNEGEDHNSSMETFAYEDCTVRVLQELCKNRGISKFSSRNRELLIARLVARDKLDSKLDSTPFIQESGRIHENLIETTEMDETMKYFFNKHPMLKEPLHSWSVGRHIEIVSLKDKLIYISIHFYYRLKKGSLLHIFM